MRQLRGLVGNDFDAVVLAGDIGNGLDKTIQIFDILRTFECPILYIYGNWDNTLAYDHDFGPNTHHLHNACFDLGGYTFAGFSGIDAHWGQNALAASITTDLKARYAAGFVEIDSRIEAMERSERAITSECEALPALPKKVHMKPVWAIRQKLAGLRKERLQLEAVLRAEYGQGCDAILRENRRELIDRMAGHPPERTIVVTHGRLSKTAKDMPDVPLFLFGHRHGFADTRMGRSRFVNVSALDHLVSVVPEGASEPWKSADIGSYTVIELAETIEAKSYPLKVMPAGWRRVVGSGIGPKPIAPESTKPSFVSEKSRRN